MPPRRGTGGGWYVTTHGWIGYETIHVFSLWLDDVGRYYLNLTNYKLTIKGNAMSYKEAFAKADRMMKHKQVSKHRANLLRLLDAGILSDTIASDLAYILATHLTDYELLDLTNEDEKAKALDLNRKYWEHYERHATRLIKQR